MIGQLVKITAARKLMIKIDEDTYEQIQDRLLEELTKKKFPRDRFATFELENENGETNHFVMISLDKYDKQLLERKFEPLLKKCIVIQYRLKSFDFLNDEDERIQGINLELTGIRVDKKKEEARRKKIALRKKQELTEEEEDSAEEAEKEEAEKKLDMTSDEESEIDEIAEKALNASLAGIATHIKRLPPAKVSTRLLPAKPLTDADFSAVSLRLMKDDLNDDERRELEKEQQKEWAESRRIEKERVALIRAELGEDTEELPEGPPVLVRKTGGSRRRRQDE